MTDNMGGTSRLTQLALMCRFGRCWVKCLSSADYLSEGSESEHVCLTSV